MLGVRQELVSIVPSSMCTLRIRPRLLHRLNCFRPIIELKKIKFTYGYCSDVDLIESNLPYTFVRFSFDLKGLFGADDPLLMRFYDKMLRFDFYTFAKICSRFSF